MRTRFILIGLVSLIAGASLLCGCNIVGPAAYFIGGPAKAKPQFILPKDRSAVVFIDDRANVLPTRASRRRAAQAAERTLLEGKAVGKADVIGSDAILSVAAQERFGKPTGIAEIGKAVGAATVVYATIDSFGLAPTGQEIAPVATARVKVVDVETRRRLWPGADREWMPVTARLPIRPATAPRDTSARAKLEDELSEQLGVTIARLFVEYVPEDVSQRVGE